MMGDRRIRCGRDFSAWLGLTPLQKSTGGKQKLGQITKMGEPPGARPDHGTIGNTTPDRDYPRSTHGHSRWGLSTMDAIPKPPEACWRRRWPA
jgi:hypothetical protein